MAKPALCHGAEQGLSDVIHVARSTGIGGGIIAGGRPLRGRRGMAGHLGHMFFLRDGPRPTGAQTACCEDCGAGAALTARATGLAAMSPNSAPHGQTA